MINQEVINLRLKFPREASFVFKDLSLSISKGEKVLLLGPSGSGKSTLLQVMSGIIPNSIEVPLRHDAITVPDSWGFVFQDPDTQFCMPFVDEELAFVLENLNVPRGKMDRLINDVLKQVGLGLIEPHTSINDLSQGMKQRLALASVLLLNPEVVYLDEPSALLDPEGTVQIWDAIKATADDKTVVIVEHKIDQIADWVDRILLFNQRGEIIADGVPSTIFAQYKEEIDRYGIWHPNVWDDYVASDRFKSLIPTRQNKEWTQQNPLVRLENFAGYHGKKEKIGIQEATIEPGSWITIVGDNGAGKSTLLLSLMHLLKTSGHYEISGKQIDLTEKKLPPPPELSLVFQNPELQFIMNSVFEEIAFSYEVRGLRKQEIEENVRRLLHLFQLDMNEERHPFQLSTGQKRRLSVATGIAQNPSILLLDEPTFGQDAKSTFAMLEILEHKRLEGTTIVMVTHDLNIVNHFATEKWTIEHGKLILVTNLAKETVSHA